MALDALGEATPEQQAELQRQIATDPALARQRAALQDTTARLAEAAAPLPAPVPLPSSVLAQVEDARTRALAKATAAQARAGGAANVVAFPGAHSTHHVTSTANPRARQSRTAQRVLAWAAVITLLAAPVGWWLSRGPVTTLATASPALAPRGETGMTQPTLVWENAKDQDYDVWILPEGADQKDAPALFVASKVRSPLPFDALQPGPANPEKTAALKPATRYLALVCLAGGGRLAGVTVPFQTAPAAIGAPPAPSDSTTALALARQLMDAGRSSDALMVLAGLPESVRALPEVTALETQVRQTLRVRAK